MLKYYSIGYYRNVNNTFMSKKNIVYLIDKKLVPFCELLTNSTIKLIWFRNLSNQKIWP